MRCDHLIKTSFGHDETEGHQKKGSVCSVEGSVVLHLVEPQGRRSCPNTNKNDLKMKKVYLSRLFLNVMFIKGLTSKCFNLLCLKVSISLSSSFCYECFSI